MNKQKSFNNLIKIEPKIEIKYFHPDVGVGTFVKEYNGRYGLGLIIKLDNGREWFAPINEFRKI